MLFACCFPTKKNIFPYVSRIKIRCVKSYFSCRLKRWYNFWVRSKQFTPVPHRNRSPCRQRSILSFLPRWMLVWCGLLCPTCLSFRRYRFGSRTGSRLSFSSLCCRIETFNVILSKRYLLRLWWFFLSYFLALVLVRSPLIVPVLRRVMTPVVRRVILFMNMFNL